MTKTIFFYGFTVVFLSFPQLQPVGHCFSDIITSRYLYSPFDISPFAIATYVQAILRQTKLQLTIAYLSGMR